jgi:hypothetical protein
MCDGGQQPDLASEKRFFVMTGHGVAVHAIPEIGEVTDEADHVSRDRLGTDGHWCRRRCFTFGAFGHRMVPFDQPTVGLLAHDRVRPARRVGVTVRGPRDLVAAARTAHRRRRPDGRVPAGVIDCEIEYGAPTVRWYPGRGPRSPSWSPAPRLGSRRGRPRQHR